MIFCLVLGEVPARSSNFVVDITNEMEYVSHIQKAIRIAKEQEPPFDHIPFNRLKLWKVDIPTDDADDDKLKIHHLMKLILINSSEVKSWFRIGEQNITSLKI